MKEIYLCDNPNCKSHCKIEMRPSAETGEMEWCFVGGNRLPLDQVQRRNIDQSSQEQWCYSCDSMRHKWQPIDTAPKDGSRVLIGWFDALRKWKVRAAYWDTHFNTVWDYEENMPIEMPAWTDGAIESFASERITSYEPTHWMPLPQPPNQSTD